MLNSLAIANYRSIRQLVVPLRALNVVTGSNGSGKSSLYRSLRLLAETAQGRIIPSLAREGGLESTLWAGPESISDAMRRGDQPVQGVKRKEPVNLRLGFAAEDFGYLIDLGLPTPSRSAFAKDPVIKRECLWAGPAFRPATLLVDRKNGLVQSRAHDSGWHQLTTSLPSFDSMMARFGDPRTTPEILMLRERIRSWRFYDHFRTDEQAPARQPQIGTHTPVLSDDGADLAPAIQTIHEIGDSEGLEAAIEDAFPGAAIEVVVSEGRFELVMRQQGLLRPLRAAELSDGTIRYLLLTAALLTPRPPSLLVLNEPETSLHPDLLPALGRLIARTASSTQVIVVSHASRLIATLEDEAECQNLPLEKDFGETILANRESLEPTSWRWPER
jgi:predicted ATPase